MAFSAGEFAGPPEAQAVPDRLVAPRAVDLGANVGLFGVWLLDRHPEARVVATADVVKLDIEGGEWDLLADPRFAALPAQVICVECHLDGARSDDPGADAERLVRAGGWRVRHELREGRPGHGLVWGRRPAADAQPADSARS